MREILEKNGFIIKGIDCIPGREARFADIPSCLSLEIQADLRMRFPRGLYTHQSEAIALVLQDHDVCISTSTASGKSLIFIASATNILLTKKGSRILAIYPAKALIHDQQKKWEEYTKSFGFSVGVLHGEVSMPDREYVLKNSSIILATPDVLHAYIMRFLDKPYIYNFLRELSVVIIDEAHVYEGAFGSNMAYLMRRLQYASSDFCIISATATLENPKKFIMELTGRTPKIFNQKKDGSGSQGKTIYAIDSTPACSKNDFIMLVHMLENDANLYPFIAFVDSRKKVEAIVSSHWKQEQEYSDQDEGESDIELVKSRHYVYPYRAGYEEEDRRAIQDALGTGCLRGVVSTSALELGLDIGDINTIVMLDPPASSKAFWQRVGRGGRKKHSICIMLDSQNVLQRLYGGLTSYIQRKTEPSYLYLDNKYCQFANALCAATEDLLIRKSGGRHSKKRPYQTLPDRFQQFLNNEHQRSSTLESDLAQIKQRCGTEPHLEFPMRGTFDVSFRLTRKGTNSTLGSITHQQMMREAYQRAIYVHIGKSYRVQRVDFHDKRIYLTSENGLRTEPKIQTRVIPKLKSGIYRMKCSENGFLMESELQVEEKLLGFTEYHGKAQSYHKYDKPITRFYETTGVSLHVSPQKLAHIQSVRSIQNAYCNLYSIDSRDIGGDAFFYKERFGNYGESIHGVSVYDTINGSLRLTAKLFDDYLDVLEYIGAKGLVEECRLNGDELSIIKSVISGMSESKSIEDQNSEFTGEDVIRVIAPGEAVNYRDGNGFLRNVQVLSYRYGPKGILYDIKFIHEREQNTVQQQRRITVLEHSVIPFEGETRFRRYNVISGEESD